MSQAPHKLYWKKNLRCVLILLLIWFAVSYGCGILLVDQLDKIRIGGFKLGFWFSQQGSIYVFVVLIWIYVRYMNKLDAAVNAELSASATREEEQNKQH